MQTRYLLRLFVVLAASVATVAFSQTVPTQSAPPAAEEPVQLSAFQVTTEKDVGYLSTNAAQATRMNTPIENIPMNVSVYNQQFIEDLLATDTSQVLAYEPSSQKTSENDGFLSRGFASVGTNFLNGFAQTAGFGSQPLANIERVEVLQGPAAVLYGSGGYGATFNRITKQPLPKAFTSFRLIGGNEHSYRFEFDENSGNLPIFGGKKLLFRINGIRARGYTWFGQRKGEDGIAPSLTWNFGPKTKMVFEYIYNWQDTQASWETLVHNGNPKGLVTGDGVFRVTPRKIHWGIPDDFRHNTRQSLATDLQHAFSKNLQFRSQFQYETRQQLQQETIANGVNLTILRDTALIGRNWRQIPRITRNYRTRNELLWDGKTGPINHRALFGLGWQQQYDHNITAASATIGAANSTFANVTYAQFLANPTLAGVTDTTGFLPVNLFDRGAEPPTPDLAHRPPLVLGGDTQSYASSQDYYVNDLISFAEERFFVTAGARHSDFQQKTITWNRGAVRLPSAPTVYKVAKGTTSSFGAVWHMNAEKTFTLYGNLNTSFSPNFNLNPDGTALSPETANQKEVGIRYSAFKGRMQFLLSYFDTLQDNVAIADPNPARLGYFIQTSGQRSTGFELKFNGRITDAWSVMGGAADIDARNDITGVAKDLQPQYKLTLVNTYNFGRGPLKGLRLTIGSIYVSERPLTNSTSRGEPNWGPMPGYWNHDIILGYRLRSPGSRYAWDFLAKVSNVTNNTEEYYVGAWQRFTILPGRDWQLSAGVRF